MNEQETGDLHTLVEEKLTADTEFQSSLEGMSDDEKAQATTSKRQELMNAEWQRINDYAKNQKIRAEKAEGKGHSEEKPEPNKPSEKPNEYQMDYKDNHALLGAKVHIDDVDEVVRFAKFEGKRIAEVLEDPTLKAILSKRVEERSSAAAANKGGARPSTHKVTGTELKKNLSEGKMPEPGSAEAEELYYARRGGRP